MSEETFEVAWDVYVETQGRGRWHTYMAVDADTALRRAIEDFDDEWNARVVEVRRRTGNAS